ncbi:siderophore-interacting protein [Rhizobium puerariae]|uniref:Siderophore-interacting protein n=1 Tax=Rhizobium puerariae TaxID=1585791 RepID=A0ABV6AG32_9HYPH
MQRMFYNVEVVARRYLTPGMIRLTFSGGELGDFLTTGIGDEYLRLFFPDDESGEVVLPIIDEEGRWTYQEGKPPVKCATYTVRRFDPAARELDIDFVVHEGGLASSWAQAAEPGSQTVINRPRGLYTPPPDVEWQLLMADATGIPALARLLEQTPATVKSHVVIEVADPGHRQDLPDHPRATVTWLDGSGNGMGPSRLEAAFRAMKLPSTPGYIWVAAEQKPVRAIRKHVRQTLKIPAERYKLVAYWIEAKHEWQARWQVLPAAVREEIEAAWQSDRDAEDVRDEVEATLEKFNL